MKARVVALVALAAAVTLTSVAAAAPTQRNSGWRSTEICPEVDVVLTPLQAGPLKRDTGKISQNLLSIPGHDVMRDGQKVTIYNGGVVTLTGKRGTLTIRGRNEWVDLGRDGNGDGENDGIARGPGRSSAAPASTPGSSGRGEVPR